MKLGRVHTGYQDNASRLHRAVGEVIKNSPLSGYTWIQEYPVARVDSDFPSKRERFDWACPDMHIVIEVHGQQHYMEVNFGKGSDKTPAQLLAETQHRDKMKKQAALGAGWTYLVVKYNEVDDLDGMKLWQAYQSLKNDKPVEKVSSPKKRTWYDKDKARQLRKEQYQRRKAWLKEMKNAES